MSVWESIKHHVKKAAKSVKKAVTKAVNKAAEVVSDACETAGNAIEDGANAVGGLLEKVPVGGKVIGGVVRWVGRVVSATLDVAGAVLKGALGIIGSALGGLALILGGIFSLDLGLIAEGFLDIVSGIAGAILVIAGKAVALAQTVLFLQAPERRLTAGEKKMLREVFHSSIVLYNVRVIDGFAGVYSINSRPFTLGNTIYMKNTASDEYAESLVHECVHVWQYQNLGAWYSSDAIGAQWFVEDAYNWRREIQRGNDDWDEFNKEAQAEFLEDVFTEGALESAGVIVDDTDGAFYRADGRKRVGVFKYEGDNTARANKAVRELRDVTPARTSALID